MSHTLQGSHKGFSAPVLVVPGSPSLQDLWKQRTGEPMPTHHLEPASETPSGEHLLG